MEVWLNSNEVAIVQWVACWLIRRKSPGSSPRPNNKIKYEKYFFGDILSADS